MKRRAQLSADSEPEDDSDQADTSEVAVSASPSKVSKTQRIVSGLVHWLISVSTIVFFLVMTGFFTNKVCNMTLDKPRLGAPETNEIQFFVNYTSSDNLYKYDHSIFVSCRFESSIIASAASQQKPTFDKVFLFDGSLASTHLSAQMLTNVLLKKYTTPNHRVLFCSYDRLGRGLSETHRDLIDKKNRFTVRHIDRDVYAKQNIVHYALHVSRAIYQRFNAKIILIGHGFGANVQSAALTAMRTSDRDMIQGFVMLDPIHGDEMRHYIRKQTNWGLFYTMTGLMRLITQVIRIQLPMRVAGVTSTGSSKYLSDSTIARRNLLLCQQKLWESARDEVDLFPALHSLVLYREKRFIGHIPIHVLTSEMIDLSDEDLNQAYASNIPNSQYIKLSKHTTQRTIAHISTSEIIDNVDNVASAVESIDNTLPQSGNV